MITGRFEVNLLRAGGLRDADFRRAHAAGKLAALLASLDSELRCPKRKNLATDHFPEYMFWSMMSGGDVSNPYKRAGVNSGGLASILLRTNDDDPTYTETSGEWWTDLHNLHDSANTSSGGKRFIEDDIEDHRLIVWADAHENRFEAFDKEAILFRSRWLYLPSQGNSNNIRSLGYHYGDVADSAGVVYRGNFGRIRLRNARGEKVIVNKTADHALFVELELELVTA